MNEKEILKNLRKQIDGVIQVAEHVLNQQPQAVYIRELLLVKTKLQEAKMWGGKCLEVLGYELPEEYQDKANKLE